HTIYVTEPGNYQIITVTDSVCSNQGDSTSIAVTGSEIHIFNNVDSGCNPLTVTFWSNTTGLNGDCIWDFGDGTAPVNNCDTVIHTYSIPGTYSVRLTVSSTHCNGDTTLTNLIQVFSNPV